tara:strand:- start:362 stop:478 length:117 start_codon:yes stop_codon:yes gene_type:complete
MKKLTCHCGGVEIEVNVLDEFKKVSINDRENHPLDKQK